MTQWNACLSPCSEFLQIGLTDTHIAFRQFSVEQWCVFLQDQVIHCLKLLTLSNRSNELVAFPYFCLETETDLFSKYFALFREYSVQKSCTPNESGEYFGLIVSAYTERDWTKVRFIYTFYEKQLLRPLV